MIMALYLLRRFLRSFLIVASVFVAILYLIDMVEQIRRFADRSVGLGEAAHLAALNLPQSVQTILPLIVLLAGIALFLGLSRSSELVAIRASGRSALRMLGAPVIGAFGVGVIAVMILNPLVAASSKKYQSLSESFGEGDAQTVSFGQEAVWLRQGAATLADGRVAQQAVIRAAGASPDGTVLRDVTFLIYADDSMGDAGLIRRIEAQSAHLAPGLWQLRGVTEWPLGRDTANPQAAVTRLPALLLPTSLTVKRIREGVGEPAAIPIWKLAGFIRDMKKAGFSARRYEVWLWKELALPLTLAAMLVIAAGFTMRPARFGRTGLMVTGALGIGLGVFFLRNLAQILGENGDIPALMAAWSPPLVALGLALGLILHLEDG